MLCYKMPGTSSSIRLLLAGVILFIAYGSLYPGQFQTERISFPVAVSVLIDSWPAGDLSPSLLVDMVLNVLIYTPIGFLGVFSLPRRSWVVRTLTPVMFAFLLSASMELLQAFVPGRVTSLLDLVANTAGAMAGVAAAWMLADWMAKLWPACTNRLAAQPGAALLLTFWLSAQWLPFIPGIGLYRLRAKLAQLMNVDWGHFPVGLLSAASAWLAAMAIFEALAPEAAIWSFLLPVLVFPVRFFIGHQFPSASELAGAAVAAVLGRTLLRAPYRKTAATTILLAAILISGLAPFDFLTIAAPFNWVPFSVSLQISPWEAGFLVLFAKAFRYGAAVWLLEQCGIGFLPGGVFVAILLGSIEWIQTYLPGRSAEITDPLLCLLLAAILKLLQAPASKSFNTVSK